MKAGEAIAATVAGTTFMTLFSHIVAEIEEEDYSEPRLLSRLLHRLAPAIPTKVARALGWQAHYAVGGAFIAPYAAWLSATGKKPDVVNGLVMGAISGLAGIAAWKTTFKAHPAPPELPYNRYYTQLFFAHLIFGVVAATTANLIASKQAALKSENAGE